ncbi:hypothetical protein A1507_00465 [Methylomonas koyamae]|uniref:Uncharacterized protein n=1 Tax=Methylomonas koyamae TaxID=702114 RepID=A0A177NK42_9GAMM|nr:hypothetical protein [Methylomonas koyamae]OAI17934.1 hypothetical protein A1507_00465 [Methylomonas koyamae]
MNLNNTKETEVRRNACWLLRLTALDTILKAWSYTSTMATTFGGAYRAATAWENKISLLERLNCRTFNTVPAGTAANDKTWRIAA